MQPDVIRSEAASGSAERARKAFRELVASLPDCVAGNIDPDLRPGGCWLWKGTLNEFGYGRIFLRREEESLAHRFVFLKLRSSIPAGLVLDHICRRRSCVNPWHLEAVTQRVNVLRGDGVTAENAKKQACPKGHAYTEKNTIRRPSRPNCRECRICATQRNKRPRMGARGGN